MKRSVAFSALLGLSILRAAPVREGWAEEARLPEPDGASRARAAGAPLDATIYRNDATSVFRSTASPGRVYESITLAPGQNELLIHDVELAFFVVAPRALVVRMKLWDTFDPVASPVNGGQLGTTQLYDFGPVPLAVRPYAFRLSVAPTIPLTDPDLGIEFEYLDRATNAPLGDGVVTVAFAGSGPTVGASPDAYYRDANGNGRFDGSDARSFGGAPRLANFYLVLRAGPSARYVEPGIDLLETPPGGTTTWSGDLLGVGLYLDFDEQGNPCVPLASACDPNNDFCAVSIEPFALAGAALSPTNIGLGRTDTIFERLTAASLPNPGDQAVVPARIAALSLVSSKPVRVRYLDGSGGFVDALWDVRMCLSSSGQGQGTMTLARSACSDDGGTFSADIPLTPKFVFTPVPGGGATCPGPISFDFGPFGVPGVTLHGSGGWSATPQGVDLVEVLSDGSRVDGDCDGQDDAPLASSTGYHMGVFVPRCAGGSCLDPAPPVVMRLARFNTESSVHGFIAAGSSRPDADLDGVPDVADDCPFVSDAGQQDDADGDAVGDACDDCPAACDPAQSDTDLDGSGDACDCAPANPLDPPAEVAGFQASSDKSTFLWTATDGALSYTVVRGSLAALPVGPGGGDEACIAQTAAAFFSDASIPSSVGYFYIVRGMGACGTGIYGRARLAPGPPASGPERRTTSCP